MRTTHPAILPSSKPGILNHVTLKLASGNTETFSYQVANSRVKEALCPSQLLAPVLPLFGGFPLGRVSRTVSVLSLQILTVHFYLGNPGEADLGCIFSTHAWISAQWTQHSPLPKVT